MLFPSFDNSYARLPPIFHARVRPTPVAAPRLVKVNIGLARELGLDPSSLASPEGVEVLAGNQVPPGAYPLASAYAGHQFGYFNPELGDGRAILLGEILTPTGERRDIQLKGSGLTAFSRRGDGRAARHGVGDERRGGRGAERRRRARAVRKARTGNSGERRYKAPGERNDAD